MVLKRLNMTGAKSVSISLTFHLKLSADVSPKIEEEIKQMSSIPYLCTIDSIMYAMV